MAKGKVTINDDLCKGCGLCTTNCPVNIVVMDTSRINKKGYHPATITNMDACIGCANCAMMCPDNVITVERF
ncbi:MAG: 4Fe-4S binding protein [Bacillota bacterium]|nr:4Fe-4S binding protein [Bacillota bacterium]